MQYVLVRHKVKDYDKWRSVYDENTTNRADSGSKGAHVFRNTEDSNEVMILYEWDNLDKARSFFESEDFKMRVQRAGVIGEPDIHFLEGIGRTSA